MLQLFSGITLDVLVLAEVADGDVVEHSRAKPTSGGRTAVAGQGFFNLSGRSLQKL